MITKITTIPKAILVLLYLVGVNESFFTSDAVCISSLDDMAVTDGATTWGTLL